MIDRFNQAIAARDATTINRLIAEGIDLNEADTSGRTPLIHAVLAEKPSPRLIQFLVDKGADVNVADSAQQWTALAYAIEARQLAIAKLLLDLGANPDVPDLFGNTPLWRATFNARGNDAPVKLLLQYGADKQLKNANGVSPADLAVSMGDPVIQQLLR